MLTNVSAIGKLVMIGQCIVLVIAHEGDGLTTLHHAVNDMEDFANGRTPIDIIAYKDGFAGRVLPDAILFMVLHLVQEAL